MRKLLVVFTAFALVLAFGIPAMAKVHMGGIIFMDAYMHDVDKDASWLKPGTNDWEQTEFEVPDITRLYGKWSNDAGDVGMHIELGLGGPNSVQNEADSVRLRHAYGWWKFSPNMKLIAGQTQAFVAPLNPPQLLGEESGGLHVVGLGFGNFDAYRHPLVGLDMNLGEALGLKLALVEPRDAGADLGHPAGVGNDETTTPRFDAALTIKFGPLTLIPSLSYAEAEFDETGAVESSYDVTAYSLGAKFATGPFSLSGEYSMGVNWGSSTNLLLGIWDPGPQMNGNSIEDTDHYAYWIAGGYKFGKATLNVYYGSQGSEAYAGGAGDDERARDMYGANLPIVVGKTFIIRPEYTVYDWGEVDWAGGGTTELGEETIAGVQFQIVF